MADSKYISNSSHPNFKEKNNDLLSLAVHGTTDILRNRKGVLKISKIIKKEHPIDKGCFKEVIVISDYGKRLLTQLRKK